VSFVHNHHCKPIWTERGTLIDLSYANGKHSCSGPTSCQSFFSGLRMTDDTAMVLVSKTALAARRQKGWRTRLLCRDCEQFLNDRYEKPMKAMWVDSNILPPHPVGSAVRVAGWRSRSLGRRLQPFSATISKLQPAPMRLGRLFISSVFGGLLDLHAAAARASSCRSTPRRQRRAAAFPHPSTNQ
jgi:hypothetical protein